jgi:hypothetical protein
MVAPADSASIADLVTMYQQWHTPDLRGALLSYMEAIVYNEKRAQAIRAVLAARGKTT